MEEEKKERVEQRPVVKGSVKIKKEPLSRKFCEVFLSDSLENVKSYLFYDVIVPSVKDLLSSMIGNGSDMLIYGRSRGSRRGGSSDRENYSRISRGSNIGRSEGIIRGNPGGRHSYKDIIFDSRGDAREVLDCMQDILDRFKMVSVADFYELAHAEECETYADRKYGWFKLDEAEIVRDRDGFRIVLPRTELLD